MKIYDPVLNLPSVGAGRQKALAKLGIKSIADLLFYFPRKYLDFSEITPISQTQLGSKVILSGRLSPPTLSRTSKRRMAVISAEIFDKSSRLPCMWFNQPFLLKTLRQLDEVYLYGYIGVYNHKKVIQPILTLPKEVILKRPILAIYSETKGLTTRVIESLIDRALPLLNASLEFLPPEILKKEQLLSLPQALYKIHRPRNLEDIKQAKNRLAFDEIFLLTLRAQLVKRAWQKEGAPVFKFDPSWVKEFLKTLPFKLTDAQRLSAWQIVKDLQKPQPMHRLLNGDVGSGKTIVAAIAALVAIKNGFQVAFMAPTQILAEQHYLRLKEVFRFLNFRIELITGYRKTKTEEVNLIIGTHALLSPNVRFQKLGLVVVDEQHRFGVKQRQALKEKGEGKTPHLLSLSATPIPRTLALVIAGELDVSFIKEKPAGRRKVITKTVLPEKRAEIETFIKERLKEGEQALVVVPIIGEEDDEVVDEKSPPTLFREYDERKSLEKEFLRLKKVFPEFTIAKLHGKMRPKTKSQIMSDFVGGRYNILLSTAVVEVGIDVKNATLMLIEDADRFGLAQLHQFRGRVGRGEKQSYCFLFLNRYNSEGYRRLKILEAVDDGFRLAEEDLKLRGPGQLYGTAQHGFGDLKMASLFKPALIEHTHNTAKELLERDPELKNQPKLLEKINQIDKAEHLE